MADLPDKHLRSCRTLVSRGPARAGLHSAASKEASTDLGQTTFDQQRTEEMNKYSRISQIDEPAARHSRMVSDTLHNGACFHAATCGSGGCNSRIPHFGSVNPPPASRLPGVPGLLLPNAAYLRRAPPHPALRHMHLRTPALRNASTGSKWEPNSGTRDSRRAPRTRKCRWQCRRRW